MRKAKKGFTIIEMLIVFGVVVFVSAILLPSYGSMRAKFALLRGTYQMAQDIRTAREMAISAQAVNGVIYESYGIYIKKGSEENDFMDYAIYIYADTNFNDKYGGGDLIIKEISLNKRIYIKKIANNRPFLDVNFKGPDPVIIMSVPSGPNPVDIILGLGGTDEESSAIMVTSSGLIYVE